MTDARFAEIRKRYSELAEQDRARMSFAQLFASFFTCPTARAYYNSLSPQERAEYQDRLAKLGVLPGD